MQKNGAQVEKAKHKVLVIDDEHIVANTLAEILQLHGFEATALYSGESALEWVESYRPDIVLSDIVMDQVDGVATAVRIRELHPACRVILFSASTLSLENRSEINRLGFEFLERPLHPKELLEHVGGTDAQPASIAATTSLSSNLRR